MRATFYPKVLNRHPILLFCKERETKMRLEVLLSCMNQADTSIVQRSRLTGDVLIINQCGKEAQEQIYKGNQRIRMVSTKQRGLSNSRNLAIHLSDRDICLLCDDDEVFHEDYECIILKHFEQLKNADVIAFDVSGKKTRLKPEIQRVNWLNSLKLSSVQLAFRRDSVIKNMLAFDPNMGAVSGNGSGEENKFLWDCLKRKLSVYYVPQTIACLIPGCSTWFSMYDKTFFYQRGAATRHMMGPVLAFLYGIYYLAVKRNMYKNDISPWNAAWALLKGIWKNPIKKKSG